MDNFGMQISWICFGGHYKIGLVLGVFLYFRVFS